MITLRLAEYEDLPAILDISNWAALHTAANFAVEPESLRSWQDDFRASDRYPWFVAMGDGGGMLGFAKASPWKGRCAYAYTAEVTVYVHAEHHGEGIGRALYQKLIPTLRAQGYRTLLAGITLGNPASEQLHQSFGFRHAGLLRQVGWKFDQWHDVAYWQLIFESLPAPPTPIRSVSEALGSVIERSLPCDLLPPPGEAERR